MNVRRLGWVTVGILLAVTSLLAQAPPRDRPQAQAPEGTARLRGQVIAADSGTPLRRAQVRAIASAIRTTRLTTTDTEGRYEFFNLPAGRYTISVTKAGYVGLEFGQRRPFEGGRPLDIADGQIADQINFALPRGAVIAGRLTDDAGDPIVGASVQPLRYQYAPGGRRRLVPVETSGWLSNMTNDLGEFRLFGLMPGTYLVTAQFQTMGVVGLTQPNSQTGGISAIEPRDGFLQTYFPGTTSVAEAQPVVVNLSEEAHASFSLATGRLSKLSGMVRRSDGTLPAGFIAELRPRDVSGAAMGGWGGTPLAPDGSFSFANVPPGQYVLDVQQRRQGYDTSSGMLMGAPSSSAQTPEFARMTITVGGTDIAGLSLTTTRGVSASGRVTFQTATPVKISERSSLFMTAAFANSDEGERAVMSLGANNGVIDPSGRFEIRGIVGEVLFRPGILPNNHVLKSVTLNGVDITDRPYDAASGDVTGLEVVIVDPAQVNGTAKHPRGEMVRDYRVVLFPGNGKPSLLTTRFVHTGSADPSGRFQFTRLPAGEYLGVAVDSFEQGQEWDPAFQKRVIPSAHKFVLREGQTLTIELPYVE